MANEQVPGAPLSMDVLAADLADEFGAKADRSSLLSADNLWINPEFRLNNRGAASYTAAGYTLDRLRLQNGTGATNTISQVAGQTDQTEFACSWDRTVAGSATSFLETRIEDVRRLGGRRLGLSFGVRSNSGGDIGFFADFAQDFGSGGSAQVDGGNVNFTALTSRERLIAVFDIPSVSGKTIGDGNHLRLRFARQAGSANGEMIIDEVDARILPSGFTPTAIPYVSPDTALDKQRAGHFYRTFGAGLTGFALNASRIDLGVLFEEMRVPPAYGLLDTSIVIERQDGSGSESTASTFVFTRSSKTGGRISIDGFSGLTTGETVISDQVAAWLEADSEL